MCCHCLIVIMLYAAIQALSIFGGDLNVQLSKLQHSLALLEAKISQKPQQKSTIIGTLQGIRTFKDLAILNNPKWHGQQIEFEVLTAALAKEKDVVQQQLIVQAFMDAFERCMQEYYLKQAVRSHTIKIDEKILHANKAKIDAKIAAVKQLPAVDQQDKRIKVIEKYLQEAYRFTQFILEPGFLKISELGTKYGVAYVSVKNTYRTVYLIGLDRVEYAISKIPAFDLHDYDSIDQIIKLHDAPYDQVNKKEIVVEYYIFRGANIVFNDRPSGSKIERTKQSNILVNVYLNYLRLLYCKYANIVPKQGLPMLSISDLNILLEAGTNDSEMRIHDSEHSLLKVINTETYTARKSTYSSLQEAWPSKPIQEILANDRNILMTIIKELKNKNIDED